MLYNFTDSPNDFWKRVVKIDQIVNRVGRTITLYPQRYEPLNSLEKKSYIGPKWTEEMLQGLKKLYSTNLQSFVPITATGNTYRWIGYSRKEFFKKLIALSKKESKSRKIYRGYNLRNFLLLKKVIKRSCDRIILCE